MSPTSSRQARSGFTLTEIVMALGISSMVMVGALSVYIGGQKVWHTSTLEIGTSADASELVEKMVYGIGAQCGLRAAERSSVAVSNGAAGWTLAFTTPYGPTNYFEYAHADGRVRYSHSQAPGQWSTIARNVTMSSIMNKGAGLSLVVQYGRRNGQFSATNTLETFVAYRN